MRVPEAFILLCHHTSKLLWYLRPEFVGSPVCCVALSGPVSLQDYAKRLSGTVGGNVICVLSRRQRKTRWNMKFPNQDSRKRM